MPSPESDKSTKLEGQSLIDLANSLGKDVSDQQQLDTLETISEKMNVDHFVKQKENLKQTESQLTVVINKIEEEKKSTEEAVKIANLKEQINEAKIELEKIEKKIESYDSEYADLVEDENEKELNAIEKQSQKAKDDAEKEKRQLSEEQEQEYAELQRRQEELKARQEQLAKQKKELNKERQLLSQEAKALKNESEKLQVRKLNIEKGDERIRQLADTSDKLKNEIDSKDNDIKKAEDELKETTQTYDEQIQKMADVRERLSQEEETDEIKQQIEGIDAEIYDLTEEKEDFIESQTEQINRLNNEKSDLDSKYKRADKTFQNEFNTHLKIKEDFANDSLKHQENISNFQQRLQSFDAKKKEYGIKNKDLKNDIAEHKQKVNAFQKEVSLSDEKKAGRSVQVNYAQIEELRFLIFQYNKQPDGAEKNEYGQMINDRFAKMNENEQKSVLEGLPVSNINGAHRNFAFDKLTPNQQKNLDHMQQQYSETRGNFFKSVAAGETNQVLITKTTYGDETLPTNLYTLEGNQNEIGPAIQKAIEESGYSYKEVDLEDGTRLYKILNKDGSNITDPEEQKKAENEVVEKLNSSFKDKELTVTTDEIKTSKDNKPDFLKPKELEKTTQATMKHG